jgi:hypothetical protein
MAGKNWISIRPPTSPDPAACPVPEVVLFAFAMSSATNRWMRSLFSIAFAFGCDLLIFESKTLYMK